MSTPSARENQKTGVKVIYLVTILTEFLYDLREILVSPAACYVYLCHDSYFNFFPSEKAFPIVSPRATYEWLTGSYVMSPILCTSG